MTIAADFSQFFLAAVVADVYTLGTTLLCVLRRMDTCCQEAPCLAIAVDRADHDGSMRGDGHKMVGEHDAGWSLRLVKPSVNC